jgi:hypothetical protein
MKHRLKDEIRIQILADFANDQQEEAIGLVANANLWCPSAGPPARVHAALLLKSKGDLQILKNTIAAYEGDWRDLLIQVGLASEDWQDILTQKGIDTSRWSSEENAAISQTMPPNRPSPESTEDFGWVKV